MTINYDPRADVLYIKFQEGRVERTRKLEEGILVDQDETGRLLGIEILGMKGRIPIPGVGAILPEPPVVGAGPAPA